MSILNFNPGSKGCGHIGRSARFRIIILCAAITATVINLLTLSGCAGPSSSTGLLGILETETPLPVELPHIVAVMPFTGDVRITRQAADRFAGGLIQLNFEVVEKEKLETVLNELIIHPGEYVDSTKRGQLRNNLNLEGMFIGTINSRTGASRVSTELMVKMIDVGTGRMVWSAEVKDARCLNWNKDLRKSLDYTVGRALKLLKRDIERLEKQLEDRAVKQNEGKPADDSSIQR